MSLTPWKRIAQAVAARNPWWTYRRDEYELPSGKRGEYHYVHTNGASMIIPVTDDGKLLLVNQYRYLCAKESIEFPCGGVKDGSSYNETAWHELREETGYTTDALFEVGEFNPYNGVTDEICKVFIARNLRYVGVAPDDTEEFEYLRLTADEFAAEIASGRVWDGMSIAAWAIAQSRIGLTVKP
jgi:ADP-ribose pyrophosphatase